MKINIEKKKTETIKITGIKEATLDASRKEDSDDGSYLSDILYNSSIFSIFLFTEKKKKNQLLDVTRI